MLFRSVSIPNPILAEPRCFLMAPPTPARPLRHYFPLFSFWQQDRELEPELPIRPDIRRHDVVIPFQRNAHVFLTDGENLPYTSAKRYKPPVIAIRLLARRDAGRAAQKPAIRQVVVDEGPEGHDVDILPSVVTGK